MLKIKRKPDTKFIFGLISEIGKDSICLPDFQGEFVWDEKKCAKLIESVIRHYPIGTLMFLNADVNHKFGARSFKGPEYKISSPSYFVIDGQQRLNTFYQFLRRPIKFEPLDPLEFKGRNFKLFLKLDGKIEYNLDKPTLILPKKIEKEDTTDYKKQGRERLIPLEFVLDEEYTQKWVNLALGHLNKKKIRKFQQKIKNIRKVILDYFCFVEVVESKLDPRDHYNIFQLLNSAGTDLTLFDELVARLNPLDINLRKLWQLSQKKYPELKTFDIDPVYILKTISLIRGTKDQSGEEKHTCAKKDLVKLYKKYENLRRGANEFNNDWDESCRYIEKALKVMKSGYGVHSKRYIPYSPMIITLASIEWWFEKYVRYDRKYKPTMYNKLRKWYWGSIFYSEYDSQTDNKVSNHYFGLRKWLMYGTQKTPKEINFPLSKQKIFEILEDIDSSADARYKGIICLPLVEMNARDIFSSEFLITSKLHDHHIFPIKFLGEELEITDQQLINNLANRMLITDSTNQQIKKKSPYEYLSDINSKTLKRYFISKSIILNKGKYQDFLEDRKQKICNFIYDYLKS